MVSSFNEMFRCLIKNRIDTRGK